MSPPILYVEVPGFYAEVEREESCTVRAFTPDGEPIEQTFGGFPSRIVQHEFDHLDGTLYVDRITDSSKLVFDEEFERYILPAEAEPSAYKEPSA